MTKGVFYERFIKKVNVGGGAFLASGRALSQVLYCNVIAHLLRNLEYVLKRSRTRCAMTGLNIYSHVRDIASLVFLGDGVRRSGDWFVVCLEVRRSRGQYIENQPSPQPSRIGEGVNRGGQSGVSHEIDCHPEFVSGSHKMQQHTGQSDVQKTLKHRCQLSVQKMLKLVQHGGNNFPKRTYSLINLFSYSPRKRCAFTLAEVLITLGVIGIVAAMTMPSLIANYQKKVWVNQLKKSVSVIEQGVRLMMADDGVDNIYYTTTFAPTASTDCYLDGSGRDNNGINGSCADYAAGFEKYFKGTIQKIQSGYVWSFYDGNSTDTPTCEGYVFILSDGTLICPWSYYITVDVNGYKRPNTYGKDIFSFEISDNGSVKVRQNEDSSKCPYGTSNADMACFAKILEDGWEMNY